MEPRTAERMAYDTLKGFVYAAAPSPDVKHFIEHELDILYESWYRLALAQTAQKSAGESTSSRRTTIRGLSFQSSEKPDDSTSEESSVPEEERSGWKEHLEDPHGNTRSGNG